MPESDHVRDRRAVLVIRCRPALFCFEVSIMFKVHFPLAEIKAKLGNAKARIAKEQRDISEAVGVKILSFA